jgi:hypothetical protein
MGFNDENLLKIFSKEEIEKIMKLAKSFTDSIAEFTLTNFQDDQWKISACFQLLGAMITCAPILQDKSEDVKASYITNSMILMMNMLLDE